MVFDDTVEVYDVDSAGQLGRISTAPTKTGWSRLASAGEYVLVEFSFFREEETTWRRLMLLDGDGKQLWTRDLHPAIRTSPEIFVNDEGFAAFDTPEGGVLINKDGKQLWRNSGYPIGPVTEGFAPFRSRAGTRDESIGWLCVPQMSYSDLSPELKRSQRGAFVSGRELVFADGAWVRHRLEPPEALVAHVVKKVRLPAGCKEPYLDDTSSPRYWRLECTFERRRSVQKIDYRVDLQKTTMTALRSNPPGWTSKDEIVCLFHEQDNPPNRDLLAHLGSDGQWYSSTHSWKHGAFVWRSLDGKEWRRVGEVSSFCGAPHLESLCGHLLARPVDHSGNCTSVGVGTPEEPPLIEDRGDWKPLPYTPGDTFANTCSEDRTRFLEYTYDEKEGRLWVTVLMTGERKLLRLFPKDGPRVRTFLWLTDPR